MRKITILLIVFLTGFVSTLLAFFEQSHASTEIGVDDILFAPSSFVTVTRDRMMISAYLRTREKEGNIPGGDVSEVLDTAEKFLSFHLGQWGVTFGWTDETDSKLLEPRILSADYKLPLADVLAVDFKFATKKLPESTLRESVLNFGVFSIAGLIDKEITSYLELYSGAMMNYIYIDLPSDEHPNLWRLVPFAGIRINVSPYYTVQIISEVNRGRAKTGEEPVWTWHLGVSIGF